MPVITIEMWEGRDKEKRRKLIQEVSKAAAKSLEIGIEHVQVIIHEINKDNWGLNGDQASKVKMDH